MLNPNEASRPRQTPRAVLGAALVIGLSMLIGCMVGPNFQRPHMPVAAKWAGPTTPAARPPAGTAEKELARWWTIFRDPTLTSLMNRAIRSNLDLKRAEARIRQARAARGVAASGLGPTVGTSASYSRSRSPAVDIGRNSNATAGTVTNQYQAGFDASWEIDIFGGVRRGVEAAEADLQASVEARRDALVSLTAEVARDYVDLRTFQQRIVIAQKNLKAQKHSALLTRQRFQGGFVSGLDVANADAQVAATAAGIPLLESSARQTIYSLSVLLGLEPAALVKELSPASAIPVTPPSVPVGVPSDLLRRRPDIRAAEAQIHAATARIGVATADLFPNFTLSASLGLLAGEFGSWFDGNSRFWSFGPLGSLPIFNSGRIRSNIELQKAFQEEDMIVYRQTVLAALQEVENELIASAKEQEHRDALIKAVKANRKAVDLATQLYTMGQTDFLNVLDAQRSLYAEEDALVQSTGSMSTDLVALFKALGGGWSK